MPIEPAEYIYIPLPRTVAAELAQLPEEERCNLCTLTQVLHWYLERNGTPPAQTISTVIPTHSL